MSIEARVQYAKTTDGVDIAFTVYGAGPPLVIPPNLTASHLQLELAQPTNRSFYERLSRHIQVIRYDPRGIGMSQKDQLDMSAEAAQRDLTAVVDKLGLDRFALYGHILAGEGPMAFAVTHPERVSSLVWWIGQTIEISPEVGRQLATLISIAEDEWDLFTQVYARLIVGWDSPEAAPIAAVFRSGSSPASTRLSRMATRAGNEFRGAEALRAPTLVTHIAGAEGSADRARALAARIPTAHLLSIPGHATLLDPFVYDNEVLVAAIADFVTAAWTHPNAAVGPPELQLGAMRAILFTDIVGHTEMMQRLGDAKGRDILREHERITRETLTAHGGAEVKAMGDGFMAWFSSAQQALDCAVALQRSFAAHNDAGAESLLVRAGINAGEPIVEDDDLFGSSVIAASRICHEAQGGEIVASDVVRQLVAGKGFSFADRGDVMLKGFDDAIRLYEVRWQE